MPLQPHGKSFLELTYGQSLILIIYLFQVYPTWDSSILFHTDLLE